MNLCSIEHFNVMTKMVKKCSTDQKFIRKRSTSYKTHTLVWTMKQSKHSDRHVTPSRTARISDKILTLMVKSGLEKNILKVHEPLQSCCFPVQNNLTREAGRYLWRGSWKFKINFSRPLFTIIFKPKIAISRVKTLVHFF